MLYLVLVFRTFCYFGLGGLTFILTGPYHLGTSTSDGPSIAMLTSASSTESGEGRGKATIQAFGES